MADTPLTCTTSHVQEFVLLTVHGHLDMSSAPRIRTALRKADAEQPAGIVIDLSGMTAVEHLPLLVLAPSATVDDPWWHAPRSLCCTDQATLRLLSANTLTRRIPIRPSLAEAFAAVRKADGVGYRVSLEIAADNSAPGVARALLVRTCQAWELRSLLPAAQVILSELCSNVVVHVGHPMTVVLTRTECSLHMLVRDHDATPPTPSPEPATPLQVGGRGLHLVTRLATAWGHRPTADGKAVWAVLRQSGARGDATAAEARAADVAGTHG